MKIERIAVVGAGAIGGCLGARLAALDDVRVGAVARGATLAALRAHGWRLDVDGERLQTPVHGLAEDPAALGEQDLVIVAVKQPALPALAPRLAPLVGPHTVILPAMNGVPWWFGHGLPGSAAGMSAARAAMRAAFSRGWVPVPSASEGTPARPRAATNSARALSQAIVAASTGNTPASAPHSVVMLAMLRRCSTVRAATPGPVNSTAWLSTWSSLKKPARVMMTSLPVTPGRSLPPSVTRATGGTCHQVRPVAQMAAASVRTMGVPRQPRPPYMLEWLSEATTSVPGQA